MDNFDEHWNTGFLQSYDLHAPIYRVHFVAFKNEKNERGDNGGGPGNHWGLFLQTGIKSSIRVDMSPKSKDSLEGCIQVWSKKYIVTDKSIKVISARVQGDLAFSDFVTLLNACGRHKYNFNKDSEGCRYWTVVVAQDLEDASYIPPGSAKEVLDAVGTYWATPSGSNPLIINQGEFYD